MVCDGIWISCLGVALPFLRSRISILAIFRLWPWRHLEHPLTAPRTGILHLELGSPTKCHKSRAGKRYFVAGLVSSMTLRRRSWGICYPLASILMDHRADLSEVP